MNVFKKFYCRAFQTVFRAALPLLPYREPEIMHSVNDVASLTDKLGVKNALQNAAQVYKAMSFDQRAQLSPFQD